MSILSNAWRHFCRRGGKEVKETWNVVIAHTAAQIPFNPRITYARTHYNLQTTFRRRAIQNICVTPPLAKQMAKRSMCCHAIAVLTRPRDAIIMATWTSKRRNLASSRETVDLPYGGTPRDEAAFSHGVARAVIAVGAM